MPVRAGRLVVGVFVAVAACRTTEPVAPTQPTPTPQGPSQTAAEAKRDGVPLEIARMTLSQRVARSESDAPSVTTDEGIWVIAQPMARYAEVLLLDRRREHVVKAFPFDGSAPRRLDVDRGSVWVHAADGRWTRIDREELRVVERNVVRPSPSPS